MKLSCLPPRDAKDDLDSIELAGELLAALLLVSQPSLALGDLRLDPRELSHHHLRWAGHLVPHHPAQLGLVLLEVVIGLFIEISFIATFTQRFFGR